MEWEDWNNTICEVEWCEKEIDFSKSEFFCSEHQNSHQCEVICCYSQVPSSWKYCSQHANKCDEYDCKERINEYKRYCNDHSKRCKHSGCQQRASEQGEGGDYCSAHVGKCQQCKIYINPSRQYCYSHGSRCQYRDRGNCNKRIYEYSNPNYCSEHSKKCQEPEGCPTYIYVRDDYCSNHQRHECSFPGCPEIILISQGDYCSNHLYECQQRCGKRISRNNSYCLDHIYGAFEEQRTRANNLQTQLDLKRQEVNWLQNQLKMEMGDEDYQSRVEENYPPRFRN